jgi:putative redox protein
MLADAHGAADLRWIAGGGHYLRHDPRAISVLMAWLQRQAVLTLESVTR